MDQEVRDLGENMKEMSRTDYMMAQKMSRSASYVARKYPFSQIHI